MLYLCMFCKITLLSSYLPSVLYYYPYKIRKSVLTPFESTTVTLENDDDEEDERGTCSNIWPVSFWSRMSSKLRVPISTSLSRSEGSRTKLIIIILNIPFNNI